ncbi:MAG: phosphodiesterase [Syntrophorhabdus sp. PtaB.Bin047]|nr:MAG: phosphodiesterase [Syntrophorhabdus sp. PtaB.Bin047]
MAQTIPREQLINCASEIKVIPTLDSIVNRVFTVLGNNNSSFNDLSEVVKYDQAISSKIISIANSAYYSRGIEIFNLQRAMLTIGFEEVRSIVSCILLMEGIIKMLKLREEDLLDLWKHSIEVASASRVLAERLCIEDPQKAYTASLLHDIGKIVFYLAVPDYGEMLKETKGAGDIVAIERERFGIDHQETGYIIAVKWKFPHDFARVIRGHHGSHGPDQQDPLLRTVNASDRFFTRTLSGQSTEAFILDKERGAIALEVEKIMEFLQLG